MTRRIENHHHSHEINVEIVTILASNNIIVMSIKQSSVITICFKNLNWFPIYAEDKKRGNSFFNPQDISEKYENTVDSHDWVSSYTGWWWKNETLHRISTWMNRKQSNFWNWDWRKMYSLIIKKKKFIVRIQQQQYIKSLYVKCGWIKRIFHNVIAHIGCLWSIRKEVVKAGWNLA